MRAGAADPSDLVAELDEIAVQPAYASVAALLSDGVVPAPNDAPRLDAGHLPSSDVEGVAMCQVTALADRRGRHAGRERETEREKRGSSKAVHA